jgi:hypothetical protein
MSLLLVLLAARRDRLCAIVACTLWLRPKVQRAESVVNQRRISFNDTYNIEHQLNYGPDTIFVRALGPEIHAWIARRTAALTYTVRRCCRNFFG